MVCGKKYTYINDFNPQSAFLKPYEIKNSSDGSLSIDLLQFTKLPEHNNRHDINLIEYNQELFMVYTIHDKIDQIISQSATVYDSNARNPPWNSWFGYYTPICENPDRPK